MQIPGYHYTRVQSHTTPGSRQGASTGFSGLLAGAAAQKAEASTTAKPYAEPIPLGGNRVRIELREYYAWQQTREPVEIPSKDGWTEENIQYLKERYPGELHPYERLEAVQTLRDMGCITQEEYQDVTGFRPVETNIRPAGEVTCVSGPIEDGTTWAVSPWTAAAASFSVLGKADTLDDLFALLDSYLEAQKG